MARKRSQSTKTVFTPRNPNKYKGSYPIVMRSRWETAFAQYCDLSEGVLEWASEPVQIPYRNPIKGSQSVYIPDFLITYVKSGGQVVTELVEIKPQSENPYVMEKSNNPKDAIQKTINIAKWTSAKAWCERRGIKFRIMTEHDLFGSPKPKAAKKPPNPNKKVKTVAKKKAVKKKK